MVTSVTPAGDVVVVIGDVMNDVVVGPLGPVAPDSDTVSRILQVAGGSGANQAAWLAHLGPADLPESVLDGVGLLHLSAYAVFAEPARSAVLAVRDRLVRRGCAVSVDPASESMLRSVGVESFLAATSGARLCFPNLDEARTLSGRDDPAAAARALTAHFGTVVVTAGPAGCVVAEQDAEPFAVGAPVAAAIDPTGAGDAFCAAYLWHWLRGEGSRSCARAAVEAGARCAGRVGGRPPVDRVDG